jgi:hypothetical protein
MVNTDGSLSFRHVTGVDVNGQVVSGDRAACERWLPWVHTFSSNAKAWILDQWDAPWGEGQTCGAVRGRVYLSL